MNQKKHIALFTYDLDYGGTERVVSRLANVLTQHYEVTIILIFNQVGYEIDKKVNIITLHDKKTAYNDKNPLKWLQYILFLSKYKRAIVENKIDTCISFLAIPNIINGYTKKKYPKLKTIISERCYPSKTYTGFFDKNIRKFLFNKYYNANNVLFSNSKYINQDLKDNFNLKINAEVIYNPVSFNSLNYVFNPYSNGNFKIISVGRLIKVKNHQGLIEAISKLNNVALEIYGNGDQKEDLSRLINKLEVNNEVKINEPVSTILEELKTHHCFILNSLTEGFPNALLEAMSVGLPVIATNCMTGPLELLNDDKPIDIEWGSFSKAKFGLMVNPNDVDGLVNAITYFKEQENERIKFSKLGFERAKAYDISEISTQVKKLIETV